MTNYLRLYFSCTFLLLLSSCNKEAAPGEKPPAVFDSSEHAKPVTVAEKEHRIYIRPKEGDIKEGYCTSNIVEKIMRQYPDSMRTSSNSDVMKRQVEATVAEYVHQILMHYSDHPYGKDSTEMAALEQNVPVANVVYPMQIV